MNSKALITLLALLGWILFCDWWWCTNKEKCDCEISSESTSSVQDANSASSSNNAVIQFDASSGVPTTGAGWNSFSDSIISLIRGGKRLEIIGYYGNDEVNNTKFANLGLARADTMKQLFLTKMKDVNPFRISTKSALKAGLAPKSADALEMQIYDTIATPSDQGGVVLEDSLHAIIYFPSGSSSKNTNPTVDEYLVKVANQLKNGASGAIVTGHTDNKGNPQANLKLSKERAEAVKAIIAKNGAEAGKIIAEGKGDQEPKGDNNTDEGRKLNRRVEITINK
jgi:OOP family OmpA-OmpF porin